MLLYHFLINSVGIFPVGQWEMSRQHICCRDISYCPTGNVPTIFYLSGYFLLPNRKYPDNLFWCRDISCYAILSGYFRLAQCRDISYWVCRDKYVPPSKIWSKTIFKTEFHTKSVCNCNAMHFLLFTLATKRPV
jgi:hypothetical protein